MFGRAAMPSAATRIAGANLREGQAAETAGELGPARHQPRHVHAGAVVADPFRPSRHGSGSGGVDGGDRAAGLADDKEAVSTNSAGLRRDHADHGLCGDGRVHGVAAELDDVLRRGGSQRMGGGNRGAHARQGRTDLGGEGIGDHGRLWARKGVE